MRHDTSDLTRISRTGADPSSHARDRRILRSACRERGPSISFSRSNLSVAWDPSFASLLELAEACDVQVRWSCRTGVCHTCETGRVSGAVSYRPDPVEPPALGTALICCSQPRGEVTFDL